MSTKRPQTRLDTASWRRTERERKRAEAYWDGLTDEQRWELGDEMVLGDIDVMHWFGKKESAAFMNALDRARLLWEQSR